MCFCHQNTNNLYCNFCMWVGFFFEELAIDYEHTVSDYRKELDENQNPRLVESQVRMVVAYSLFRKINTTRPMIIIINECRNENISNTFGTPNCVNMALVELGNPRSFLSTLYHCSNLVHSGYAEHHTIIHPSCNKCIMFINSQKKSLNCASFCSTVFKFLGGGFIQK